MSNLYCADIIQCEGFIYEDLDTLVEYARQNPKEFVIYSDIELVEVKRGDEGLDITYTMVDDYDDNDNPIMVTKTETFDIEYKQMMVTVKSIHELLK